ncbi:MAG: preprotein translocase subunit YajC [Rhodanobacteraceae bacterium]
MLSLITAAAAAASSAPKSAPNPLFEFAPLIVLVIIFYFLLIRPQSKRAKEQKKMIADLAKGDEVVAAGIVGRVDNVGEHFVTLEVADNVHIRVQKGAVSSVLPKGTLKSL